MDSRQPRSSDYDATAWSVTSRPLPDSETRRQRRTGTTPLAALLDQHLTAEMLGLWLLEVLVCTLVVYGVLSAGDTWQEMGEAKAAALALTFGITSVAVGLCDPDVYMRTRQLLLSSIVGALLAVPAIWVVARLLGVAMPHLTTHSAAHAGRMLLAFIMFLFGVRLAVSIALRSDVLARKLAVVGSEASAARMVAALRDHHRGVFELAGLLPPDAAALADGSLRQRGIRGVILTAEAAAAGEHLSGAARPLRIYTETEFWESQLRRIDIDNAEEQWAGEGWVGPRGNGRVTETLRRGFDVVLSVGLLVFTAPLMLLAALAIKLDSPGPVVYRQQRVGLGGRPFTLMKFRSMRVDAEARGPVWASRQDSRVTRVGSIIRLVRIDELPQLCNVLRGEMSFIGPRPERPHFVEQLQRVVPLYAERALVKPGLTGWAQVNYPYGASVEDARAKLSYDLYYIKHRSLLLDLLILLATVRVVLFQRGAR